MDEKPSAQIGLFLPVVVAFTTGPFLSGYLRHHVGNATVAGTLVRSLLVGVCVALVALLVFAIVRAVPSLRAADSRMTRRPVLATMLVVVCAAAASMLSDLIG